MKLLPLSLLAITGNPYILIKRLNAIKNLSVVISVANSIAIDRVVKHVSITPKPFFRALPPYLNDIGPK